MNKNGSSQDFIQSLWKEGSKYTHGRVWEVKRSLLFSRKGNQSLGQPFGHQMGRTCHVSKMSWTMNTMVSVSSARWNYAKKPNYQFDVWSLLQLLRLKGRGNVKDYIIWEKGLIGASECPQSSSVKHVGFRHYWKYTFRNYKSDFNMVC